jgi:predicted DNA-binding protein with PD1-like motif
MEYSVGSVGRVIAARFRDNEPVYAGIEEIARRENVASACVLAVGGVRRGKVVVGPKDPNGKLAAMTEQFDDARELVAVGTLHRADGQPALHLHGAIGRGEKPAIVGCPRQGLDAFLVLEVFIIELLGLNATREIDPVTGLHLLELARATQIRL